MKLLKKAAFALSLPFRNLFNGFFFSEEVIYLVIPFNNDKVLDIDRIVIYHDYDDAMKEMEYLKDFYEYVTIRIESLNFKYVE